MQYNLADLWARVVDTVPERESLVCGDRRLTYAEADERANRLAHHLAEQGVGPGDHVALYLYNGTEYVEGMLAAFKLRAVPVNVNYRYVEEELRYLLDDSDSKAIVFHREFGPKLEAVRSRLPLLYAFVAVEDGSGAGLGALSAVDYEQALAGASPERGFEERSPDDLYILYTGGTTGMPKGVMWRAEDIFFAALGGGNYGGPGIEKPEQIVENLSAGLVTMALAPLMHGNAQWTTFIGLYGGNSVVLNTSRRFDADEIWDLVEHEKVTVMSLVGDAMARPLVDALAHRPIPPTMFALT